MKKYIIERAIISLKLTLGCFVVPFAMSLLAISRKNGYMLLLMVVGIAALCFSILMLPCIRFAAMIRRQERAGYPFESGEICLLSNAMMKTYLGTEWIIHAGSVAIHHTQCKFISGKQTPFSRRKYAIVVETIEGRIYQWPLSRQNVKRVQDWLKLKSFLV